MLLRLISRILIIVVVITGMVGCTSVIESRGPVADLATIRPGRAMRSSSADPNWENGNGDCRPIPPGETLELGELNGPGEIQHIWFTISAQARHFPRMTTLRIYWDGNEEPSVEAPLGDFFAVGHGLLETVDTIPVQVSSEGRAYNCYWPMPFRKSAKITVTNDSDQPVDCLFWYIDWVKLDEFPEDGAYFHAQYRQEYPCIPGGDYLILDTVGKGHYVGTVLSVQMAQPSWFGEGDDRFYIDGEETPSLRGTGTEDYFCDAWGFRQFNQPYHGVTVWEGFQLGDRGTAYRWHIPDPEPFEKSLRVTIEHKGAVYNEAGEQTSGFGERADYFSSVAYWYQTEPAPRFAAVPPAEERVLPEVVVEVEEFLEESTFYPPEPVQIQPLMNCSGGNQILFTTRVPDSTAEIVVDVPVSGEFLVSLDLVHSWDYGIYDITFDGETVFEGLDLYSPDVVKKSHRIGLREIEKGRHTIGFTCVGANPKSEIVGGGGTGYFLGVDALVLRKVTK